MSTAKKPAAAPATTPAPVTTPAAPRPAREGGSFVVDRNGKPVRQEYTRQPGDPDHEANVKPAAEPAKDA